MKKLLSLSMAIILAATLFGCGAKAPASSTVSKTSSASSEPASSMQAESSKAESSAAAPETVAKVAALKGPTAMGMVKLMDDTKASASPAYEFSIAASPDEVTPKLVQGELDIAAIPANLASVIYNQTQGKVRVINVNTLGVLYIVESGDSIKTVADLKGKTIYASGKGATPEYALNYMLSKNGIDPASDVTIEWKAEHTECVAALAASENAIAMLPQPFVTTAQTKNDKIRVALDMTAEWEKLAGADGEAASLITGVTVARTDFIEKNPELVKKFLTEYEASVQFAKDNSDAAAELIGKFEIVPAPVAKLALPKCNIACITGDDMKTKLSGYLQTLFDQNPKAVGGKLPTDDFYYLG